MSSIHTQLAVITNNTSNGVPGAANGPTTATTTTPPNMQKSFLDESSSLPPRQNSLNRQKINAKGKHLTRSHAMRESTSPPRTPTPRSMLLDSESECRLPNNISPQQQQQAPLPISLHAGNTTHHHQQHIQHHQLSANDNANNSLVIPITSQSTGGSGNGMNLFATNGNFTSPSQLDLEFPKLTPPKSKSPRSHSNNINNNNNSTNNNNLSQNSNNNNNPNNLSNNRDADKFVSGTQSSLSAAIAIPATSQETMSNETISLANSNVQNNHEQHHLAVKNNSNHQSVSNPSCPMIPSDMDSNSALINLNKGSNNTNSSSTNTTNTIEIITTSDKENQQPNQNSRYLNTSTRNSENGSISEDNQNYQHQSGSNNTNGLMSPTEENMMRNIDRMGKKHRSGANAKGSKPRLKHMSGSSSSIEGGCNNTSGFISRDSSTEHFTDQRGIDLIQFFKETLNKNPRDRNTLLRIEKDLNALIIDRSKDTFKFPPMTSYNRMLIHRVAAYFGMDHNVDPTQQCVIAAVTKSTRVPEVRFKSLIKDILSDEPKKSILKRDAHSFEEYRHGYLTCPDRGMLDRKAKSFEEREEEYERAKRRIFKPDRMGNVIPIDPNEDHYWPNWSSSDSSDQSSRFKGQNRLLKANDSRRDDNNRPYVSKAHSFGGYGGPPNGASVPPLCRGDSVNSTKSAGGRLFSKQDSLGSQNTPWRLSPSSSGYKTQTQSIRSDSVTPSPTGYGSGDHTPEPATIQSPPSTSTAPTVASGCGTAASSSSLSTVANDVVANAVTASPSACGVVWAVTDMASVPRGSVLIDPQTLQPIVNPDGSIYHFDPSNLPPPHKQHSMDSNLHPSKKSNHFHHTTQTQHSLKHQWNRYESKNNDKYNSHENVSDCNSNYQRNKPQNNIEIEVVEQFSGESDEKSIEVPVTSTHNDEVNDEVSSTTTITNDYLDSNAISTTEEECQLINNAEATASTTDKAVNITSPSANNEVADSQSIINCSANSNNQVVNEVISSAPVKTYTDSPAKEKTSTTTTYKSSSTKLNSSPTSPANNAHNIKTTQSTNYTAALVPVLGYQPYVENGTTIFAPPPPSHQLQTPHQLTATNNQQFHQQSSKTPTTYQTGPDGSVYAVQQPIVYAYPPLQDPTGELSGYFVPMYDPSATVAVAGTSRDAQSALISAGPAPTAAIYSTGTPGAAAGATTTVAVPVAAYQSAPVGAYGATPIYAAGQMIYAATAPNDQYGNSGATAAAASNPANHVPYSSFTYPTALGYSYPYNGYWGQAMTYYVPQQLAAATPSSTTLIPASTAIQSGNGPPVKRGTPPQHSLQQQSQVHHNQTNPPTPSTITSFTPGLSIPFTTDPATGATVYATAISQHPVYSNMFPYSGATGTHPTSLIPIHTSGTVTLTGDSSNIQSGAIPTYNSIVTGSNTSNHSCNMTQSAPSTPITLTTPVTTGGTGSAIINHSKNNPPLFPTPPIIPNGFIPQFGSGNISNTSDHTHYNNNGQSGAVHNTYEPRHKTNQPKRNFSHETYGSQNRTFIAAHSATNINSTSQGGPKKPIIADSNNSAQFHRNPNIIYKPRFGVTDNLHVKTSSPSIISSAPNNTMYNNPNVTHVGIPITDKPRGTRPKPLDLRKTNNGGTITTIFGSNRNTPSTNSTESNNSPNSIASYEQQHQSMYISRGAAAAAAAAVAGHIPTYHPHPQSHGSNVDAQACSHIIGTATYNPGAPGVYVKFGSQTYFHQSMAFPTNSRKSSPPNDMRQQIGPLAGMYPAMNMMLTAPRPMGPRSTHPNPNYKGNRPR